MQELEKILEEIDKEIAKERAICEDLEDTPGWRLYEKTMNRAKDIIRKHVNDDWIPVEVELPEQHEESSDRFDPDTLAVIDTEYNMVSDLVQCTVYDFEKDEYFVCDDCTVNGKWCNFEEVTGTYKVIAWQPLPEPYRPERRKDGQAD